EDGAGNGVTNGAIFTATSGSGGTVLWYTGSNCTGTLQTTGGVFTINAGTSTIPVYYDDSATGSPWVTISSRSSPHPDPLPFTGEGATGLRSAPRHVQFTSQPAYGRRPAEQAILEGDRHWTHRFANGIRARHPNQDFPDAQ